VNAGPGDDQQEKKNRSITSILNVLEGHVHGKLRFLLPKS
jgi:hypothetical protein